MGVRCPGPRLPLPPFLRVRRSPSSTRPAREGTISLAPFVLHRLLSPTTPVSAFPILHPIHGATDTRPIAWTAIFSNTPSSILSLSSHDRRLTGSSEGTLEGDSVLLDAVNSIFWDRRLSILEDRSDIDLLPLDRSLKQ
jgi:hypothetical protein